jgi:uncharacterized protein
MTTATARVTRESPGAARYRAWSFVAGAELVLAGLAVVLDLLIPALVVLLLAGISLAVRRTGPTSLGFHSVQDPWRMAGHVLVVVLGWSLVQLGVVMPVLNHLTGERQDLSAFEDLQGNAGLLVLMLVASWTLAALGEETAFRGYLQSRVTEIAGNGRAGVLAAVLVSSVLFALIHTEQGVVGVVVTFLDALVLSWLRWHHRSLWAAVLGHGFNNTIGLVTFFAVGPVYGLW